MRERVYARLRALDSRVRVQGISAMRAGDDPLIPIGMETGPGNTVVRSAYGMLDLSWQVEQHPEWPAIVETEAKALRAGIKAVHKTPLRFLFWCASGAGCGDKAMYQAAGLLRRGPRLYLIDSTDPVKLRSAFEDIQERYGSPFTAVLRSSLVVGAGDWDGPEIPLVNLDKISNLYERYGVDPRPNFIYMAPEGSPLDKAGQKRGWRRTETQLDNRDTATPRHTGPLTRASLYPLALAKADIGTWMAGACLDEEHVQTAWRLASFIHAQGEAGRDKLTLLVPKAWAGAGPWTKICLEESLADCIAPSVRVALACRPKLANYRSPREPAQDRAFLAVQVKGLQGPEAQKIAALRRAGYPVAVVTFPRGAALSRYMQFMHYTVFGLAWLRGVYFGDKLGASAVSRTAACIHRQSEEAGGIERTPVWRDMLAACRQVKHEGLLTLRLNGVAAELDAAAASAPELYAAVLNRLAAGRSIDSAQVAFFGDTRYSDAGAALRKTLERAGENVFRARLKMPVDIVEAPAMLNACRPPASRCFSTLIASDKPEQFAEARYGADHHRAQFLAAHSVFARNGCPVVAVTLKNMEEDSLAALEDFFHRAAVCLKTRV